MRSRISLTRVKNQEKVKALLNGLYTNVERLSCGRVEDLGYFQNLGTKNNDRKAVTERVVVQTTVLQLYLI